MGRDLIINVDMIIVQGVKKYRGMTINEDLLPAGHTKILMDKNVLLENAPVEQSIKNYDEITVNELKEFLTAKQITWPTGANKKDLYELYKNNA